MLGTKTLEEFKLLKSYLDTQKFYSLKNNKDCYSEAVMRYFLCRKAGITIKSTIDMLIVQTCLTHDLALLHNDSDFDKIAKVEKNLVFY